MRNHIILPLAVAFSALSSIALAQPEPSTDASPSPTLGEPAHSTDASPSSTLGEPAQSNAVTENQPSSAELAPPAQVSAQSASESEKGLQTTTRATVVAEFVNLKPADVMSSSVIGATVYNNQNESLGEIEDLVIEDGKTITGIVVNVGGFLGLGESYVALNPATVVLSYDDGTWRAHIDTNRDDLMNAPKFQYHREG